MSKDIYTHKHHIIPKHMGGTDDPSNLIELTVEQHAHVHKRLYELYGYWQDKLAWQGLAGIIGKEEIVYRIMQENGRRAGKAWLGKTHTEEAKAKIRKATTGVRQSEETRAKKRKPCVKPKDFADKIRETRKSTTNFRQGVIAYNIKYKSIRAAARAVGYSHTNVRAFCLDENNRDFRFDTCK